MILVKLYSSRRRQQEHEEAQTAAACVDTTTKKKTCDDDDDDTATVTTAYDNRKLRAKDVEIMKSRIEFTSKQLNKIALLGFENEIKKLKAKKLQEAKEAQAAEKKILTSDNHHSSVPVDTTIRSNPKEESTKRKSKFSLFMKNSPNRTVWFQKNKTE